MTRKSWKHNRLEELRKIVLNWARAGVMRPKVMAEKTGITERSIRRWLANFRKHKEDAVKAKPKTGRKPKLNDVQLSELSRLLDNKTIMPVRGWNFHKIQQLIENRFKVVFKTGSIWRVIKKVGWEYQLPYYKQSKEIKIKYGNKYRVEMHKSSCTEWKLRKIKQ